MQIHFVVVIVVGVVGLVRLLRLMSYVAKLPCQLLTFAGRVKK